MDAVAAAAGCAGGAGGAPYAFRLERRRAERALELALSRLLRSVFLGDGTSRSARRAAPAAAVSPDPTGDRRAAAKRARARVRGAPQPLLFRSSVLAPRPRPTSATVYLDVSGSMGPLLARLHAALVPLRHLLAAEVLLFSTEIVPLSRADFVAGRGRTTGGTSIEPVLHHAAERGQGQRRGGHRALVLSDGWFTPPSPAAQRALEASGCSLHLAVLGGGPLHDRAPWFAGVTRLPDPPTSGPENGR
jgi:hypothetical protein